MMWMAGFEFVVYGLCMYLFGLWAGLHAQRVRRHDVVDEVACYDPVTAALAKRAVHGDVPDTTPVHGDVPDTTPVHGDVPDTTPFQ